MSDSAKLASKRRRKPSTRPLRRATGSVKRRGRRNVRACKVVEQVDPGVSSKSLGKVNPSVNDQAEKVKSASAKNQKYSDKLSAINNVDPYELPDSVWCKDLDSLPPYSYGDFYEYLLYKLRCVTKEEMRSSFKSREGWGQFRNGWVKDIHIYKPENCENTVVLAKVIHPQQQSHGPNNSGGSSGGSLPPPATPWAILAPSGAVSTAHCTCMADAAEQTCGHVEALLLKTEEALRTKDEDPLEMARLLGFTSTHAGQCNVDDDDEEEEEEDYEDDEDEYEDYDDEDGDYGDYIDYDYLPSDYDEDTDDINKLPGMMVRVRGERTRQLCLYQVVEVVDPETGVSSKSLRMTDDFTNTDPSEEIARKQASVAANQRFTEKLAAINNVDPYKLPESEWRKDRLEALPPTTIDDLYEYLVKRVSYVTRTEFMRYKDLMAFKQYCEGYVKNLHIYQPENCENTVVLAKFIYPKSPNQPMTPWVILEPSGRVSSSHCTCPVEYSCTHVEALLFKTQDSVHMRQKESGTDALWFIPGNVGYEVEPKRISEIDFSGEPGYYDDYGDSDDDDDEDGYEDVEDDDDDDDDEADDGGAGDGSNARGKMLSPPTEEEKEQLFKSLYELGLQTGEFAVCLSTHPKYYKLVCDPPLSPNAPSPTQ